MKYKKFEEWMVGKSVTYGSYKGKVIEGSEEGKSLVYVLWEADDKPIMEFVEGLEFVQEPENMQVEIDWQVGQEVWCAIYGKGVVEAVLNRDNEIEVRISGDMYVYTTSGAPFGSKVRTLFFSEPVVKIEGDKYPPKKPFTPTLKKGDEVVVKTKYGINNFYTVDKETEQHVCFKEKSVILHKSNIEAIHKLGEEVKL